MDIYHYSRINAEFVKVSVAKKDPIEGKDMLPGFATTQPPPVTGVDEVARFTLTGWEVVPDFRGTVYWKADGSRYRIRKVNEEVPPDGLPAEPPVPVGQLRQKKIGEIKDEGLRRIQLEVPVLDSFDDVRLLSFLWPALDTAQFGAPVRAARDIYAFAQTRITMVKSATRAQLASYDPTTDNGWP